MKKIIYFAPAFYPENSGYANAMTGFIHNLSDFGIRVNVVTPQTLREGFEELNLPGVNVFRIKCDMPLRSISASFLIYQFIKRRLPKKNAVVFYESGEYPLLAVLLQNLLGFDKVIMRVHGCYETEFAIWRGGLIDICNKILLKVFFYKSKKIVSTNSYHVSFIIKHYLSDNRLKAARKHFFVIPNVVKYIATQIPEENELPFYVRPNTFFSLGRMGGQDSLGQKGFLDLIVAWRIIRDMLYDGERMPNLVLIGQGEGRVNLEKLTNTLNLTKEITFIDSLTRCQVSTLIKSSVASILPSRYEGFSMFGAEVVASGSILIGTEMTGLTDMIIDGETGFLVAPHSPDAIADAVLKVLRKSPECREKIKVAAKELFNRRVSGRVIAHSFESVINI